MDGYGLRGGYCSLYQEGLYYKPYDGPGICMEDCSAIAHCNLHSSDYYNYEYSNCAMENGKFLCFSCDRENDFYESDDHKSCVFKLDCSSDIEGCLRCNGTECIECDTSKNFELVDGECRCDGIVVNGVCQNITKCNSTKVEHCQVCYGDSICYQCEYGYRLADGKCSFCENKRGVDSRNPCSAACSVANCNYCSGSDTGYCVNCTAPYEPFEGRYVDATPIDCPNVEGCSKCAKGLPNYCIECNDELNFTHSRKYDGTCVCKKDFDYVNKQCVRPIGPYILEGLDYTKMNQMSQDKLTKGDKADNNGKYIYTVTTESLGEKHIDGQPYTIHCINI